MIECIIFDLDDTLYPEWSFIQQGFISVSEKLYKDFNLVGKYTSFDIYEILKNIYFNHAKVKIFDQLPKFIIEIRLNEQYIVNELIPTYRFSKKKLECYSDVKPALEKIQGKIKIGMVTNGNAQVQNYKIDLLEIRNYFDQIEISGYYTAEKAKPSPHMLLKILDLFNVEPNNVLYIGDNQDTDKCSIDAGCHFLKIVRTNVHTDNDCQKKGSVSFVNDFIALQDYIQHYSMITP